MVTKEQIDQFITLDAQVRARIQEVVNELLPMRGFRKHEWVNVDHFEDGNVTVSFEDGHCGNCIETEWVTFPVAYLVTENWKELEQTRIDNATREAAEKKAKAEEAAALEKIAKAQQKEIADRKLYETLKEKYEQE